MADDGNVKVFCRVRPPNEREGGATPFTKTCVTVPSSDPLQQTVLLQLKGMAAQTAPKMFTFDRVFHEHSSQNEVFEIVGVPITKACLEGYNGTIFAYGQTGSGKTFTMQGPDDVIDTEARSLTDSELGLRGLVPRVFDYLFQDSNGAMRVPVNGAVRVEHTFACSFMEIYNERVYDLLDHGSTRDSAGLILRENGRKGVTVEGLIESVVSNAKQAAELMAIGARNRRVGQTAMNRESSRSHSVFVLQIQSKETTADGLTRTRLSRFNLVDLAGSERQKNTEAAGERLKEAGSINKSLSALGNVIMGLVEQSAGKNRHVHYRDSKLTFLLKDSLGGNSKTFMIATVSPAEDSSHETLSTLKFAARAKLIRNNAVINEDTIGNVIAMQEEIMRLRRQLQEARGAGPDLMAEARLTDSVESRLMGADGNMRMDGATTQLGERLLELEDALAYSLEQNEDLKRSNGQLSMRSSHLHALCADMKKSIAHMKLLQRLRGNTAGHDEAMAEYVPSADAIEWRMKYEDLEEAFVELQDRLRDGRALRNVDDEVQKLNLMYFTLSKQLAQVIRDKHNLHGRLQADSIVDRDASDGVASQEAQLVAQVIDLEARLNAVCALNTAAEEKAQVASLELLQSKQKEAAWKIEQQQSEIVIAELQKRLQEMEVEARNARESMLNEKRRQIEFEMAMQQEAANAQQEFEHRLAEKMTENFELKQRHDQLHHSLSEVTAERDGLRRELGESSEQLGITTSELKTASVTLKSRLEDIERLTAEYAKFKDAQDAYCHELQEKLVASQSSHVELTEANSALQRSLEGLKSQNSAQAESISSLEGDIRDRQTEKDELLRIKSSLSQEIDTLTAKYASLEAQLAEESNLSTEKSLKIEAFVSEVALRKAEISSLTAERNSTKEKLLAAVQQAEDQRRTESGLREKIVELEQVVSDREKELGKSTELLHITEEALRECKAELDERTESYESTIKAMKHDFDELTARLESTVADHEKLVSKLREDHQHEVTTLRRDFDAQAKESAAQMEILREKLNEEEARFERTTQEHEVAIHALRSTLEKTEADLVAEKDQHAADKEQAEQEITSMIQSHEAIVVSLKDAAAKQQRDDESKIVHLKESVESARKTIDKRDAAIVELGTKIAKVQQDLARAELKIEEYVSTIGALDDARTKLESSVEELEQKLRNEVDEKTAAQHRASKLDVELESQVKLVCQHESTITSTQELAQDLQNQIERLVTERDNLVADLENSRQLFKEAVSSHEEATASLRAKHGAEVKRLTDEASMAISELEAIVATMTTDVEAKLVEIKSLREEIEQHLSSVRSLENNLSSEKSAKETVVGELENAKAELEDRARRLIEKNESLDRANQQIEETEEKAKEETVRLSGRIQLLEADLKDLSRAHDVLTSSHDTLSKEHEDTLQEKRELERANSSSIQRATELSQQLEESLARITTMSDTIKDLEGKLAMQTEEAQTLKRYKEDADKTVSSLQAIIAQREEDLDEKDSVISGMEETIENLVASKAQALDEVSRGKQVEATMKSELEHTQELLQASTARALHANEKLKVTEVDFQAAVKEHNSVQERLQQQLTSVAGELDVANQLISSQKSQLAQDVERIDKLTGEATTLVSRIESLEATIQTEELARQALEAKYREMEDSLSNSLSATTAELQEVKSERDALVISLQEKTNTLRDQEQLLVRTQAKLTEAESKIASVELQSTAQLDEWNQQESQLKQQIDDIQRQLEETRQNAEQQTKEANQIEESFEREIQQLRQELDHTNEKAVRQRKRNDTLHERNEQLSLELEEKTAKIAQNAEVISSIERELEVSRAQQATREGELLKTKLELSSTAQELAELSMAHDKLAAEYAGAKDDLKAKQAAWEAKDKELRGRMTVVGEMEVQIADESKKVTDEKVLVAQRKKEYERIKTDYEQLKTKVAGLETLKIQLSKEKDKYRREVISLNQRLDDISKENDKLVGHDNKRQRIQHHIKVKEENNRLIEEVRKLTDEKIKLEVRIGKLELSLKEKENLVNEQLLLDAPRSPSSSNITNRATQPKLQSVPPSATKAPRPATEDGIEGTPAKKRLRSRLE